LLPKPPKTPSSYSVFDRVLIEFVNSDKKLRLNFIENER
jgi:hypothetical protein